MATDKKRSPRRGRWLLLLLVLLVVAGAGLLAFTRLRQPRHELLYQKGQLYLQGGDTGEAVASFRSALEAEPGYMKARLGLARALVARKEFEEAETALHAAAREGLDPDEEALLRARLLGMRGAHRLQAADQPDVRLCDAVIAEDLQPAIDLLSQHAPEADQPGLAYTRLGELHMQKSGVLATKWRLLQQAAKRARDLDRPEEAEQYEQQSAPILPLVVETQQEGLQSYRQAIEVAPERAAPRMAVARHLLSTYLPRPRQAADILEPVVERNPGHWQARLLLAQTANLTGDYPKALEHIDKVSGEARESWPVLTVESEILLEAERWEKAERVARGLVQARKRHPVANYLRGRALLEMGRASEAAAHLQNVFAAMDRPWPEARFALARALMEVGNRQQGIQAFTRVMEDTAAMRPTTVYEARDMRDLRCRAALALADALMEAQPATAVEHALEGFGVSPERPEAYQTARRGLKATGASYRELEDLTIRHVAALLAAGQLERALEVTRGAIEEAEPEQPARRLQLLHARLLVRQGSFREAEQLYEQLREDSEDLRPAYELARLYARLGRSEEARTIYREMMAAAPQDTRAVVGLVALLAREGQMEEAQKVLGEADERFGSGILQPLLMAVYLRGGQMEDALALARTQVQADPDQPGAHVVLAELLWRDGQTEAAAAEFQRALEADPAYLPGYRLALVELQRSRSAEAVALLRQARAELPDRLLPMLHLAVALQSNDQLDEAVGVLEQALQAGQPSGGLLDRIHWYLAVMHAARGELEAAERRNAAVRTSAIGTLQDRSALLEVVAGREGAERRETAAALSRLVAFTTAGCPQASRAEIAALSELMPGQPLVACWRLRALDAEGKHQEAVEGYRQLIRQEPEFLYARLSLADSHVQHGDAESAVMVLEGALPIAEGRVAANIHLRLGQFYERLGWTEKAIASYRAAMEEDATAPFAANNLAYLLATEKGDIQGALALAEEARRLAGSMPEVLDTLGWLRYLNGDFEEAVNLLENARRGLPDLPTVRYHLAMAYLKLGRKEEARSELREALSLSSTFPEADRAAEALRSL
ncbi:MAG: tetratricopeptide repeat protein [Candidatus Brocadiia bacterium]